MANKSVYKVMFYNQSQVYEIYAHEVLQSGMYGFIEVAEIIFGEKSSVVIDPSEEKLKNEFHEVTRTYLPMHAVIRIDEVKKQGTPKISDSGSSRDQVVTFPNLPMHKNKPDGSDT